MNLRKYSFVVCIGQNWVSSHNALPTLSLYSENLSLYPLTCVTINRHWNPQFWSLSPSLFIISTLTLFYKVLIVPFEQLNPAVATTTFSMSWHDCKSNHFVYSQLQSFQSLLFFPNITACPSPSTVRRSIRDFRTAYYYHICGYSDFHKNKTRSSRVIVRSARPSKWLLRGNKKELESIFVF